LKVAVPSEGPDFDAKVGDRLGFSPYLLLIDLESKEFEALRSPREAGSGAGMQMVALIIAKKSNVLLAKWCSPTAEKYLSAYGVRIVTGISGTVAEALGRFERQSLQGDMGKSTDLEPFEWKVERSALIRPLQSAFHQVKNLMSAMISVIFLVGLLMAFLSEEFLPSLFSGSIWWDSLWGACLGSLFAGNPINSYILGGQMLEAGVSVVGVTAFLCSWVTVGFLQLPAESAALGWRFAIARNVSCFCLSIAISLGISLFLNFFEG